MRCWRILVLFLSVTITAPGPAAGQTSEWTRNLLQELSALEAGGGKEELSSAKLPEKLIPPTYAHPQRPGLSVTRRTRIARLGKKPYGQNLESVLEERRKREFAQKNRQQAEIDWNKGLDHWQAGDFKSAIGHFQMSMQTQPDNPHGHWNLGVLYNRIGNGERAIYHMNQAYRIYLQDRNTKEATKAKNRLQQLVGKYGPSFAGPPSLE